MTLDPRTLESQAALVSCLRRLAGSVTPAYSGQKEFFIVTLNEMTAEIETLKQDQLSRAVAAFCAKLEAGTVKPEEITALKEALDNLVPAGDFNRACACLAGSPGFIKERLGCLRPLCIAAGERRAAPEKDPAAERLVGEAYRRLQFDRLEEEARRFATAAAAENVLARARACVGEYCAVYRLPLDPGATLPSFSLSLIDAVAGACYRLLARLRYA
jgi:hypothetical protein